MTDAGDRGWLVPIRAAYGTRGAVTSPHHLASSAGLAILRAGGGAVDAAIATNAALAVVSSSMCGLGGDAFWLIWDGGILHALNGSGRSGAAATLEAARAAGMERMPFTGPWTVTVPGAIRSWADAHERFGRLPWRKLLEPAIELAEGFAASPTWVTTIERGVDRYGAETDWGRVFRPTGRPWRVGERVVITGLAATLRRLAEDGPLDAYEGALARRAANYLASRGTPVSAADLAAHRSTWDEPIRVDYRGIVSTSHPPNSSGPVALLLLAVLGCFDAPPAEAFERDASTDARWLHVGLEAARLTLAERDAWLTDPEAMQPGALERFLDPSVARDLAGRIDPDRAGAASPLAAPTGGGTVFLATADRWGSAVSLIESNYAGFGSGLADPQTGVAYQNRGAFFTLDPSHPNVLAPRKRTMHTLTPGMLFRDGRPWIVHGSMGGEIQPQLFAQFVSAVVDGGLDVARAVAAPRWSAQPEDHHGPPTRTVLERRFPDAIAEDLGARGHQVEWALPFDSAMGHEHALELIHPADDPDGLPTYAAAADPRSEGGAACW